MYLLYSTKSGREVVTLSWPRRPLPFVPFSFGAGLAGCTPAWKAQSPQASCAFASQLGPIRHPHGGRLAAVKRRTVCGAAGKGPRRHLLATDTKPSAWWGTPCLLFSPQCRRKPFYPATADSGALAWNTIFPWSPPAAAERGAIESRAARDPSVSTVTVGFCCESLFPLTLFHSGTALPTR